MESVYTGNRIVGSNPTLSANRFHNPFSSQSQVVLKAPRFRSAELKALHSDSEPTGQNLFFQPGFL